MIEMDREELIEHAKAILHWADGGEVQYWQDERWNDSFANKCFDVMKYRRKPELKMISWDWDDVKKAFGDGVVFTRGEWDYVILRMCLNRNCIEVGSNVYRLEEFVTQFTIDDGSKLEKEG